MKHNTPTAYEEPDSYMKPMVIVLVGGGGSGGGGGGSGGDGGGSGGGGGSITFPSAENSVGQPH